MGFFYAGFAVPGNWLLRWPDGLPDDNRGHESHFLGESETPHVVSYWKGKGQDHNEDSAVGNVETLARAGSDK
jgi:hypothetical protein